MDISNIKLSSKEKNGVTTCEVKTIRVAKLFVAVLVN
jgi:hypothetical protein